MMLLRSLFRLREQGHAEKLHLLDHLEALRRTLLQMGGVLLLATLLCFAFSGPLMDFLRRPAERVWSSYEREHLPAAITPEAWKQAKAVAALRPRLSPHAAQTLAEQLPRETELLSLAPPILEAAALLPEEKREAFVREATGSLRLEAVALELLRSGALLPQGPESGNARLMGAFRPGEAFLLSLDIALAAGLVLSFPALLWLLLRFILPGLHRGERRLLLQCTAGGTLLFIAGCAFAYFGVLPRVLLFFFRYSESLGIANDWRIGYYLSFTAKLVFIFGAVFELPVFVLPLIRLHLLTAELMRRTRAYAFVLCMALALMLAPAPDPGTMLLMALPMYALYELCILIARRMQA